MDVNNLLKVVVHVEELEVILDSLEWTSTKGIGYVVRERMGLSNEPCSYETIFNMTFLAWSEWLTADEIDTLDKMLGIRNRFRKANPWDKTTKISELITINKKD